MCVGILKRSTEINATMCRMEDTARSLQQIKQVNSGYVGQDSGKQICTEYEDCCLLGCSTV
jgi:hypothetical protein